MPRKKPAHQRLPTESSPRAKPDERAQLSVLVAPLVERGDGEAMEVLLDRLDVAAWEPEKLHELFACIADTAPIEIIRTLSARVEEYNQEWAAHDRHIQHLTRVADLLDIDAEEAERVISKYKASPKSKATQDALDAPQHPAFAAMPLVDDVPHAGLVNGLVNAASRIARGAVEDGIELAKAIVMAGEQKVRS